MPTVADVIAQTLRAYNTEKFFCLTGGDHDFWIALKRAGIQIINCRSENAAVYMADGYARVSGKPGFVYGQRGPGVPNVAASMPDPFWAMSPVISFTSSISNDVRDRFEYQELDGMPFHAAVTKWNKEVRSPERAAAMLRAAIRAATGPVPGPVHLEIPGDMYTAEAGDEPVYREENLGMVNARRVAPMPGQMRLLIERLLTAKKPLIVAGNGVIISEAWGELLQVAEALSIPVATTLGGKGSIAEDHPLSVGVIGRNSRKVGNDTVRAADLILVVGSRIGGLATHRWQLPFHEKRILQIDADPQMIGHNCRVEFSVMSDAKLALQDAVKEIEAGGLRRERTAWANEVTASVEAWRKHANALAEERPNDGIHPAEVLARLREVMKPEDLIAADTGAHGAWVGSLFPVRAGRTMVRANGSLGWVFPGALGATLANPNRRTVAVSGDGGILYHMSEFETALRYNIPTVVVVLNNACLASEYHSQKKRWKNVIPETVDFLDVDFGAVARAYGAYGVRVEDGTDLTGAIKEALASNKPALIDVKASKEAQSPSANYDKTRLV